MANITETYTELALEFQKTKSEKIYRKLYIKMYPNIRNYVFNILKDMDVTNDIVANTMIKLYERIDEYNPEFQISTWAYKIAYNEAMLYIRERNKRISLSHGYEVTEVEKNYELGHSDLSSVNFFESDENEDNKKDEDYLEEQRILTFKYNAVIDAIYGLKPIYKQIMIERFLNGLSYQEIEDKCNEDFIDRFEELQQLTDNARYAGQIILFKTLKIQKDAYKKKHIITGQTVKNRIARGRKIIVEKLKEFNEK